MQSRQILEAFYGFALAAVLAIGPPLALLMIPGVAYFALLLPIWSIGVVCLLFLGLAVSGRMPYAIGVAIFALASALSPLGKLIMPSAMVVGRAIWVNNFVLTELEKKCAIDLIPLKKASANYGLLVLDNIATTGEQNYDIADTVAVLTGMRVVEISRTGHDLLFYKAWETKADPANSCAGAGNSAKVNVSPRGSQRSIRPLAVDVCLRRTEIPNPSLDDTPAIVLTNNRSGAIGCNATEVAERLGSAKIELGRVHYDSYHQRFYPNLSAARGVPLNNWLVVLLSEVLQRDLSDKALKTYVDRLKK